MVHHVPTNFKNCAASLLSGKYDLTVTTVVSWKMFEASWTFCLLFPGCRVLYVNFGAFRRLSFNVSSQS